MRKRRFRFGFAAESGDDVTFSVAGPSDASGERDGEVFGCALEGCVSILTTITGRRVPLHPLGYFRRLRTWRSGDRALRRRCQKLHPSEPGDEASPTPHDYA